MLTAEAVVLTSEEVAKNPPPITAKPLTLGAKVHLAKVEAAERKAKKDAEDAIAAAEKKRLDAIAAAEKKMIDDAMKKVHEENRYRVLLAGLELGISREQVFIADGTKPPDYRISFYIGYHPLSDAMKTTPCNFTLDEANMFRDRIRAHFFEQDLILHELRKQVGESSIIWTFDEIVPPPVVVDGVVMGEKVEEEPPRTRTWWCCTS